MKLARCHKIFSFFFAGFPKLQKLTVLEKIKRIKILISTIGKKNNLTVRFRPQKMIHAFVSQKKELSRYTCFKAS